MEFRYTPHRRGVALLAAVAAVGALAVVSAGVAGALGGHQRSGLTPTATGQVLHVQSHLVMDYANRRADGLDATTRYNQGDSTTDSWLEIAADGTPVRIKNVTTNRDGKVTQEELMANGADAVYFPNGIDGKGACISTASWYAPGAALPVADINSLRTAGFVPATPTDSDRAAIPVPADHQTETLSRAERFDGATSFRHVVTYDARDGAVYGDVVWAVHADGSESLWEARTRTRPETVTGTDDLFTLPAAPTCGGMGVVR